MVREHTPPATHRHLTRREVQLEPPDAQPRRRRGGARAPQHRTDPRQQLAGVEGLGEVVVRADFEANDLVDIFALGGEHDDGQARPLRRRADLAAHVETVHAGQHQVEQDDVGTALSERHEAARPVARGRDVDLVLAEVLRQEGAQAGVVVDEEGGRPMRHTSTVSLPRVKLVCAACEEV